MAFEQFQIGSLLGKAPFANWGPDEFMAVLEEVYGWAQKVPGPLNSSGDAEGCRLENGRVTTPKGFKEAWKSLYQAGWRGLSVPEEHGGQQGPYVLHTLADELMAGANVAFNMYPSLTQGVMEVIAEFGTDAQKHEYCPKLNDGTWGGTMCLTEPHAGSDVGSALTLATRVGDGTYRIKGTKIFISSGDHDLANNILHLVLARTPDAPAGTKGLSLFAVFKLRPDGASNDVKVASIEHKMGIKASSTCVLNFGEDDGCVGYLIGTEEQQGISQMFRLMNFARIGVGVQGLALAGAAYQSALAYAKDRKQGSSIKHWKDASAPRVAIIEHADVRRMLLDMKSMSEGLRALAVKLSVHLDHVRGETDAAKKDYHQGQVDLLVPLLKAYGSDQAFAVCATAIQVFGGAGYLRDWPVEQYCRDAKILSIYEGTNHIQALDLVGRKLMQRGGANVQAFVKDVSAFIAANANSAMADELTTLKAAADALTQCGGKFMMWFGGGKIEMVSLAANRFLEMMSETVIGWLLCEGALIASKAKAALPADHPDVAFYEGKIAAAQFFVRNRVATVPSKAQLIMKEDRSALELSATAFSTL